jgi:hypothetical protein
MRQLGFTPKFTLLAQEAHLTKNSLLSAFDLLLRANYFQEKDGYFYSSFFHLTIGLERLMKLAVISDYMLKNSYTAPGDKYLRNELGHEIVTMYQRMVTLSPEYRNREMQMPSEDTDDYALLRFLGKFATKSRYFNLNEMGQQTEQPSPLEEWCKLAFSVYEEYTKPSVRERRMMGLFYKMDREGIVNGFTRHLSFDGHPMQVYDILYLQLVIEKSAPLFIWKIIKLFQPVHFILDTISHKADEYEVKHGHRDMTIPHYSDFFYFFNADYSDIMRRKKWLEIFNK